MCVVWFHWSLLVKMCKHEADEHADFKRIFVLVITHQVPRYWLEVPAPRAFLLSTDSCASLIKIDGLGSLTVRFSIKGTCMEEIISEVIIYSLVDREPLMLSAA